jgi:hypothetical protein
MSAPLSERQAPNDPAIALSLLRLELAALQAQRLAWRFRITPDDLSLFGDAHGANFHEPTHVDPIPAFDQLEAAFAAL